MKRRMLPSIPQSLTVFAFWLLMAQDVSPAISSWRCCWRG